jgi:L-fuculose-phosphate aldolase
VNSSLRADLADGYRKIDVLRLTDLSSGNISARTDDGMLISPSGATAEQIGPKSFVFVGADGRWDDALTPSSEWQMHLAIYRACDEAAAIVHTHSDSCVALASLRRPLPGFTYVVGFFGGTDVPCIPYSTFGSEALADDAASALRDRTACLMANHGMIVRGTSLTSAIDDAHRLEVLCRQYLLAMQVGDPVLLTDEEWQDFFAQKDILGYGQLD